jgi:hypothetical protein
MKERALNSNLRELLCWGEDVCKCLHSEQAHNDKCTGLTGNNFDRDCKCKKYRPKDNLKYLEKKYEEKLENERRNKNKKKLA